MACVLPFARANLGRRPYGLSRPGPGGLSCASRHHREGGFLASRTSLRCVAVESLSHASGGTLASTTLLGATTAMSTSSSSTARVARSAMTVQRVKAGGRA